MNSPFRAIELKKPSFMQRLLKQQPEANAVIELNNLFATNPILEIGRDDIEVINKKYAINLYKEYGRNLLEFYAFYLNDCLENNRISVQEASALKHLQKILEINTSLSERLKQDLGGPVYRNWYKDIVADGILEGKKMEKLMQLKVHLNLSDEFALKVQKEINKEYLDSYINKLLDKGRMSPADKTDFDNAVGSLGLKELITTEIKSIVSDLINYWEIENRGLSPIEVDLKLPKGEECYFSITASWWELKPSAAGMMSGKLKLNKLNIKKPLPHRNTGNDRMTDQGILYITNKKILFVGEKKHTIKFETIDYIKPYSNGVAIDKEAGRDIFLEFGRSQDLFCLVLGEVVSNIH